MTFSGRRTALLLLGVLLGVLCTGSHAYPYYWGGDYAQTCTDHPARAYGQHKRPEPDNTITFAVTDASGAVVTSVCPGSTYKVAVGFPEPREAFLTAADTTPAANAAGIIDNGEADQNVLFRECTNRQVTQDGAVRTLTVNWKAPAQAAGTGVKFEVTSAAGLDAAYKQSSVTLLYRPAAQCSAAAGAANTTRAAAAATTTPAAAAPTPAVTASSATLNTSVATTATNASAAAAGTDAAAGAPVALSSAPVQPIGNCPPSNLGYQCMLTTREGITIHYSRGTPVPNNPCTASARPGTVNTPDSGMLHFAAQAATEGYVALAFPETAGVMVPAEAVIGYVNAQGTPIVRTHRLTEYSAGQGDTTNSWASTMGVITQGGTTTICFSRPINSARSTIRANLDPAAVSLNWAMSRAKALVQHDVRSGGTISLEDGTVAVASSSRSRAAIAHGALMIVAFASLMPLGALVARSKWLFGRKEGGIPPAWYHSHIGIQVSAVLIALASFILAWVEFGTVQISNSLWEPHRILGTIVIAMAVVQVVIGMVRPGITARGRQQWRWLHYGWGRLALLGGIVNLFLGSILIHELHGESKGVYVGVTAGLVGAVVLAFAVLEMFKIRVQQRGLYDPNTHRYGTREAAALMDGQKNGDLPAGAQNVAAYAGNGQARADMEAGISDGVVNGKA